MPHIYNLGLLIVVCNLIQNACDYKNLAVTKDIATLAELSNIEVTI